VVCLFVLRPTPLKVVISYPEFLDFSALRAASKSGHEVLVAKPRFSSRKRPGPALCRRKKKKPFLRGSRGVSSPRIAVMSVLPAVVSLVRHEVRRSQIPELTDASAT